MAVFSAETGAEVKVLHPTQFIALGQSFVDADLAYVRAQDAFLFASDDYETLHVWNVLTGDKLGKVTPSELGADPSPKRGFGGTFSQTHAYLVETIAGSTVVMQIALKDASLVRPPFAPARA